MKKKIGLGIGLFIVIYILVVVTINVWNILKLSKASPESQLGTYAGYQTELSETESTSPQQIGRVIQPGESDPLLEQLTYRNEKELQTLSLEDIARIYNLINLEADGSSMKQNNTNRIILENLFYRLPRQEIMNSKERLREAVAQDFGSKPAEDFVELLEGFNDYFAEVERHDARQNSLPEDQMSNFTEMDALRLKKEYQDTAFGEEKASRLFSLERASYEIMQRHMEEYGPDLNNLSDEDRAQMMKDFNALMNSNH